MPPEMSEGHLPADRVFESFCDEDGNYSPVVKAEVQEEVKDLSGQQASPLELAVIRQWLKTLPPDLQVV